MKSAHTIANECGLKWEQVQAVIQKEEIVPAFKKGRFNYYDKYQEDYIHTILYFTCMIDSVIYESKMNIQETFEEFKKRTYTR